MTQELTLIRPDDWHLHVRDGAALNVVVPHTAAQFGRAIIMPNLKPPVTTAEQALAYNSRILAAVPAGMAFEPLMTLYLTDNLAPSEIARAKAAGLIVLDPLASLLNGADENSASSLAPILNALAELSRERAVLVIHHSSKPASDKGAGARDPFASIRGSSAIFAAADSAAILDTAEDGLRAKLTIRPRDARRSIIDLERDAEGLLWRNASAPVVA